MIKMTTLFQVSYHAKGTPGVISPVVRPENAWVYTDPTTRATRKYDGTAIAVIGGFIYYRYDAKHGKTPPEGAIPCIPEPDPVSTHWPHWVLLDANYAYRNFLSEALLDAVPLADGTYELCGPKIGTNPERLDRHTLFKHGADVIPLGSFSFECIRDTLASLDIEGLVFHNSSGQMCKIRKTDYGFKRAN